MYQVRIAKPVDAKLVRNFVVKLNIDEGYTKESIKLSTEEYKKYIADGTIRCFIAELNSQQVGVALCYTSFSTWNGKSLELGSLFVNESHRSQGVGKLLFAEVSTYAKKNGFKRMQWLVISDNINAIKFYESQGAKIMRDLVFAELDLSKKSH